MATPVTTIRAPSSEVLQAKQQLKRSAFRSTGRSESLLTSICHLTAAGRSDGSNLKAPAFVNCTSKVGHQSNLWGFFVRGVDTPGDLSAALNRTTRKVPGLHCSGTRPSAARCRHRRTSTSTIVAGRISSLTYQRPTRFTCTIRRLRRRLIQQGDDLKRREYCPTAQRSL